MRVIPHIKADGRGPSSPKESFNSDGERHFTSRAKVARAVALKAKLYFEQVLGRSPRACHVVLYALTLALHASDRLQPPEACPQRHLLHGDL